MAKANTHSTHVNNANSHYSLPRAMEDCLVFFTHFTSMLLREQILLPPTHTQNQMTYTHKRVYCFDELRSCSTKCELWFSMVSLSLRTTCGSWHTRTHSRWTGQSSGHRELVTSTAANALTRESFRLTGGVSTVRVLGEDRLLASGWRDL